MHLFLFCFFVLHFISLFIVLVRRFVFDSFFSFSVLQSYLFGLGQDRSHLQFNIFQRNTSFIQIRLYTMIIMIKMMMMMQMMIVQKGYFTPLLFTLPFLLFRLLLYYFKKNPFLFLFSLSLFLYMLIKLFKQEKNKQQNQIN